MNVLRRTRGAVLGSTVLGGAALDGVLRKIPRNNGASKYFTTDRCVSTPERRGHFADMTGRPSAKRMVILWKSPHLCVALPLCRWAWVIGRWDSLPDSNSERSVQRSRRGPDATSPRAG